MAYIQTCRITFLSIFLFGFTALFAQPGKKEVTWNYLPDEHRDMTVYPYDKEAEAVILHDLGEWAPISIEKNKIAQQRHRRIKIFKEGGLKLKDVVLEYKADEKITGLKARTINYEDEKKTVTNLKLKYLPEEDIGQGRKRKSFTFRDVKVGSIIEYQYILHTDDIEYLKTWYFQEEIPVLHSEVRVDNFRDISYSGFPQMYELEPYRQGRYRMRHIKALKKEPFVGNWNDYRAGIRFQMEEFYRLRTEAEEWKLITRDLQEGTLFLDDSATQEAIYSLTQSLIRDAITEEEKVAIIYNHVRKNVRWNQKSDTWMTKTPSKTYKDREGSSVEINMLLTQMLWMANLDAYRLFYCTRDKGLPAFYPIRNQFNDMLCIVKADDQTFLLDATDPLRPYDLVPKRALNRMGWMIKDSIASWVKIPKRYSASFSAHGLFSIEGNGSIHGECKEIYSGYKALEAKENYRKRGNKMISEPDSTPFEKFVPKEINGAAEPDVPVTILYDMESRQFASFKKDTLLIESLLHYRDGTNPFESPNRSYPIDFGHIWEKTILLNFIIPEGYQVEKAPQNIRLKTMDEKVIYEFACTYSGKTIQLRNSLKILKPIIQPEDYSSVREIYHQMTGKQKEKIILIPSQ